MSAGENESRHFSVTECPWYIPELPPLLISKAVFVWDWLNNAIKLRVHLDDAIWLAPYQEGLLNLHQVGPDKTIKLLPPDIRAEVATEWQIFLQNHFTGIMPGTMQGMN